MGGLVQYCVRHYSILACTVLLLQVWSVLTEPVHAQTTSREADRFYEVFSGIDATPSSLFGYAGVVRGLGRPVSDRGFRLKVVTGTGWYDYDTSLPAFSGPVNVTGDVFLAEFMVGYQFRRGEWTAKLYGGMTYESHELSPKDPANPVRGSRAGVTGQVELWKNFGSKNWLSLDAGYTDTFGGYRSQIRFGHRVGSRFTVGVEGAVLGNEDYNSGRGGLFARTHFKSCEITLTGGLSGDEYSSDAGIYGTFGVDKKF